MAAPREIEDVIRTLTHHEHDHAPIRDLNGELDRRETVGGRVSSDVARALGSWSFLGLQALFVVAWVLLNTVSRAPHWDAYPFPLLNLLLAAEALVGISVVLMGQVRAGLRSRIEAQQRFEVDAKEEEEERAIMAHLEAQDEIMLQLLYRLERSEREVHRLTRRSLPRNPIPSSGP